MFLATISGKHFVALSLVTGACILNQCMKKTYKEMLEQVKLSAMHCMEEANQEYCSGWSGHTC